jgi:hypothetical protein
MLWCNIWGGQGDALSATLFNLILHKVIQNIEVTGTIVNKWKQILGYADDIVLVGRNITALWELLIELEKEGKKVGLNIKEGKTKYMKVTRNHTKEPLQKLRMWSYNFESVREFTYLGVSINNENKIEEEIQKRIVNGNFA